MTVQDRGCVVVLMGGDPEETVAEKDSFQACVSPPPPSPPSIFQLQRRLCDLCLLSVLTFLDAEVSSRTRRPVVQTFFDPAVAPTRALS